MKITIVINGKPQTAELPTCWEKVNFGQFLELTDALDDPCKILSVFTGVDIEIIRTARIENLDTIIAMLSFLKREAPAVIPRAIMGYPVPTDLGFETIAQFEDLKAELKTLEGPEPVPVKDQLSKYPLYVATYCIKPYSWKEAEKLAPKFLNAPASEVLAIGNFTLAKLIGLKIGTEIKAPKAVTRMKKLKLAITGSLRRLGLRFRLRLLWLNTLLTKKMRFWNGR